MRASDFSRWATWPDRAELAWLELPGVYVLAHSTESLAGCRFAWIDKIVYIGMTNSKGGLSARLRQFDDTIAGNRVSHGGADRVRFRH